jgi:hypothetical protein
MGRALPANRADGGVERVISGGGKGEIDYFCRPREIFGILSSFYPGIPVILQP